MKVHRSIVLTALIPSAAHDVDVFANAVQRAERAGVDTVEFYTDFTNMRRWSKVLEDFNIRGVYLAAHIQKIRASSLCSLDDRHREDALELAKACVDAGIEGRCWRVLLSGGRYPEQASREVESWNELKNNLKYLAAYCENKTTLSLEPGDRDVDAMQLAGPTAETVAITEEIVRDHPSFRLTMDLSHIAQLNESPKEAVVAAAPYCDHVHVANCVLRKDSAIYGDKHPYFDEPQGFYRREQLQRITRFALRALPHPEVTIAAEIITKGGIEELDRLLNDEEWLFLDSE